MQREDRDYSIDILRIFMMFFIVLGHCCTHTGIRESATVFTVDWFGVWGIQTITTCAVNVFVLITGFFFERQQFSLRKMLRLWCAVSLVSALSYVVALVAGKVVSFDVGGIIGVLFPVLSKKYWFFTMYFLLMVFTPSLVSFIRAISKEQHKTLVVIIVLVFYILPVFSYIFPEYDLQEGYSIIGFVSLYIIGAYIKRSKPQINKVTIWVLIAINSAIMLSSKVLLTLITSKLSISAGTGLFYHINTIFQLAQAVLIFLGVYGIKIETDIRKKVISFISTNVFIVYLIHDNPNIRVLLWGYVSSFFENGNAILIVVVSSTLVFMVSLGISFVIRPLSNLYSEILIKVIGQKRISTIERFFNGTVGEKKSMQKNRYKTLLSDTLIFALGSFGSKVILFLLVPLYTNILSTEEYGIAELVYTISELLMPFVSLVIFDAVIRFGLKKAENKEDVLLCALVVMVAGCIVTILITPTLGLYVPLINFKWYICAYVISYMSTSIFFTYLKVMNKNRMYAFFSILQTFLVACLNIVLLAVLRIGVRGYLLSNIIAHVITAILVFVVGRLYEDVTKAKFKKDLLIQMIKYSAPLVLNNVSWWIIHSSDKIMIEIMITASALGLYTVATKIPSLINTLISIFSQAWGLSAVREYEDTNDLEFYSNVFRMYATLCFGMCVCLVSITKLFMRFYVGKEFLEAWRYVPLLLVAATFSAIASYFGTLYGALQKSVNNMLTTLTAAVTNFFLNYYFIRIIGLWGAVLGTMVAYVVIALIRMADVRRYIPFKIDNFAFILTAIIAISQAILVSIGYNPYVISAVAITLFIIVQRKSLALLLGKAKAIIRR